MPKLLGATTSYNQSAVRPSKIMQQHVTIIFTPPPPRKYQLVAAKGYAPSVIFSKTSKTALNAMLRSQINLSSFTFHFPLQ